MTKGIIKLVIASFAFLIISCGGKSDAPAPKSSSDSAKASTVTTSSSDKKAPTNRKGKLIYKQYCVICHGADGKLAISDAKDLSVSTISIEERIDQITNGKGLMTPYKDILSTEQILAVAEYIEELKK